MFLKLHFLPKAPSESPVPITTGAECRVSGVKRKRKEGSCFDTFQCRDFHWSRGGEEPCNQRDSPTLKTCTRGNDMNLSHFCEQYFRWRVLPVDSRWLLQQVEDSQLFTTKLNCTCSCSAVSGYISYSRLLHKKSFHEAFIVDTQYCKQRIQLPRKLFYCINYEWLIYPWRKIFRLIKRRFATIYEVELPPL